MIHAQPPPAHVAQCRSGEVAIPYERMKPGAFNVIAAADLGLRRIASVVVLNHLRRAPALFYATGRWQGGYVVVPPPTERAFFVRPASAIAIANGSAELPGKGAVYVEASDCR